jgi:non-specific protein-tyrosine kinase
MNQENELNTTIMGYINPLIKWWWVLTLATIIAAISAYLVTSQSPLVYQARTTLLIGRSIQDPNPSSTELGLSSQLANAYADIALREPIREAVKASLGLNQLPKYTSQPRGIFLELSVTHTDPTLAQAVANELANQLILMSPTSLQQVNPDSQAFTEQQITDIMISIEDTKDKINTQQSELASMESAIEIARTQNELTALEDKLTTLQTIYANLISSSRDNASNTLSIFEIASLPTKPIGPNKILIVLLAAVSGLLLATGAVYIIEFLDDTIKTPEDVSRILDLPVLGYISVFPKGSNNTLVADQPRSPIAEAFRTLRVNVNFANEINTIDTLMITSPEDSDGKTTVAVNLAISYAQADQKVILMDSDLRSPSIHKIMETPLEPGLNDVFENNSDIFDVVYYWKYNKKLIVVPAGSPSSNPSAQLGSNKINEILSNLEEVVDIVIIDAPPSFVTDSLVLSVKADAVLLIINSGQTRRKSALAMIEHYQRAGSKIIGVVLNQVQKSSDYYKQYYSSSYYDSAILSSRKKEGLKEAGKLPPSRQSHPITPFPTKETQ